MSRLVTELRINSVIDVGANTWTTVTWSNPVVDDAGCWDSDFPTLLTVPSGQYLARVSALISFLSASGYGYISLSKTGGSHLLGVSMGAMTGNSLMIDSGWIIVAPGDTFFVQADSGSGYDVLGDSSIMPGSYFRIEFPGPAPITLNSGNINAISYHQDGTSLHIIPATGYTNGVTDATIITDANFISDNIASGVSVFGLTGTLIGGASEEQIFVETREGRWL